MEADCIHLLKVDRETTLAMTDKVLKAKLTIDLR